MPNRLLPTAAPMTSTGGMPLLMNVQEVAGLLRISDRSVWRLVASGDLPAPIALGRSRRWPRAQIEAWVAAKAGKAGRP